MKTLHYSIIAILVIGISFFIGENAYGCLGNCPPIMPPPHYTSPQITVRTNLENYTTTDKLIISSHVFNPNNKIPLVIKIFNPSRELESVKIFPVSLNENYTWMISPPIDFYHSGNYTVLSQFGEYYAVTHFYLNSTITQYYLSQAPLKQFRMGTFAQDIHCHTGFQLFFKAEDYTPACAKSETTTVLVQRGWAMAHLPDPFIEKFEITGLQQSYAIGQSINASVTYSGYTWYAEPNVKILDASGTQIWFNCAYCYARSEPVPHPSLDTFTYVVTNYSNNNLPVINKTGTYTMIASRDNKTASAEFIVTGSKITSIYDTGVTPMSVNVINTNFTINYNIFGGNVSEITQDPKSNTLIVLLQTTGDGRLTLKIPRTLLDSKSAASNQDTKFIILVDKKEVKYTETTSIDARTLTIPFGLGAKKIEITAPVNI